MKRSSLSLIIAFTTFVLGVVAVTGVFVNNRSFTQSRKSKIAKESTSPIVVSRDEELAVYSALLEQVYPEKGKQIVIADRTIDCPPYEREPNWRQDMLDKMPEVHTDTFGDYLAKTKTCFSLNENTGLSSRYIIISDDEVMDIIRSRESGWSKFYQRYPNSIGFITLGRIGFNTEINQALAYMAVYYSVEGHRGFHVLLSKKNDVWVVERKYNIWG